MREDGTPESRVRTVRVGLLGFGTVGTGAYRMLEDNRAGVERKAGLPIAVTRIGVREAAKARALPSDRFTTDLTSIVDDPEVDVIVEVIGGVEPAAALVERALRNGKHVVTANKELIAKHGSRLVKMAKARGLDLHYEAAVGGGIPIVQPLKHQLAGNDIVRMMGILNGTTNYILTRMEEDGQEYGEALAAAQTLGYAEADPTADVEGFDTMYKISILASIAFGRQVDVAGVSREGIGRVSRADMAYAETLGYRIRLLGIADAVGEPGQESGHEAVRVRVHPTLVPRSHPLASVSDVYNALWLRGDFVGDLMFSGRGAGSDPTASAVVGDLVDVGRNLAMGGTGSAIPYDEGMPLVGMDDLMSAYYVRLTVVDRPNALGAIATAFGAHGVSLAAMEMRTLPSISNEDGKRGEVVFLTHESREADFQAALASLSGLEEVRSVESWLRVETLGQEIGR